MENVCKFVQTFYNFVEKVVIIHRGEAKFFRLSHDVVTCDVDRDVSTAYC